jgi:lysophospholipase L1-like esterase
MVQLCSSLRPRRSISRLDVEQLEDRCLLDGASFAAAPIVPLINPGMKAHLQAIYNQGLQMGNRPEVFAKVGDSISWEPNYLDDLGSNYFNPSDPAVAGSYTGLASTIGYFRFLPLPGGIRTTEGVPSLAAPLLPQTNGVNSFNRESLATYGGWTTSDVLSPARGYPEASEMITIRPAFALIMLGTNDVDVDLLSGGTPQEFQSRLMSVVNTAISLGVIPVLSTIPDILPQGPTVEATALEYNQIIADVASSLNVPLWNYWQALQTLPNKGISVDGVHPSSAPLGTGNFTDFGLLYGFNIRNLTAVEVLDKLKRVVIDNGAPDMLNLPLTAPTIQYVSSLYDTLLGRKPDAGGLNSWGELIENGLPRPNIVQSLWQSAEHRALQVSQYYSTYLHRTASAAEQAAWVNVFLAGASEAQVQVAFLASPEYQASHAGVSAFVAGLYNDVLGRAPDAAGQDTWTQALQTGLSLSQVALAFLTTPEAKLQVIDGYYQAFLNRPADAAGVAGWLGSGLPVALIGEALLASDEYFAVAH